MMQGRSNPSFLETVRQGRNLDAGAQSLSIIPGIGPFAKAGVQSPLFRRALEAIGDSTGLSKEARSDAIRGKMSSLYDEDQTKLAKEAINKIADSQQDRALTVYGIKSAEDLATHYRFRDPDKIPSLSTAQTDVQKGFSKLTNLLSDIDDAGPSRRYLINVPTGVSFLNVNSKSIRFI